MSQHLPPFASLKAFCAVGQFSGIRRAADNLGVSHAIVSRHLRSLEQNLGVILYDRSLSQLTLAGRGYHARIAAAITELDAASSAVRKKRQESLVIWCSPGLAHQWLPIHLAQYSSRYKTSVIDLRASDFPPDLANNEADGDVRYLSNFPQLSERGISYVELAKPNVVPVASPDCVAKQPRFRGPSDLLTVPLIHEGDDNQWQRWFACQGISVTETPRIAHYGHAHLALAAAKAGQGVALGSYQLCADDIAEGRLVVLSPSDTPFQPAVLGAYVFQALATMWEDSSIVRFRRWLLAEFESQSSN